MTHPAAGKIVNRQSYPHDSQVCIIKIEARRGLTAARGRGETVDAAVLKTVTRQECGGSNPPARTSKDPTFERDQYDWAKTDAEEH